MHYIASGIAITNANPSWLQNNFSVPVLVSNIAEGDDSADGSDDTCSETNSEASVTPTVGESLFCSCSS